jgi:DNA-binding GntR family transcriptional regulator
MRGELAHREFGLRSMARGTRTGLHNGALCIHFGIHVNLSHAAVPSLHPLKTASKATPRSPARAAGANGRRQVARQGLESQAAAPGSTQRIVDSVTTAIVERRLMPGTKLKEQQIADIFSVSRTVVRQALNQLSRDRLVTLEPARGAFVAQPSINEARQVFEVRQMLEVAMLRRLCAVITDAQLRELRAHLAAEREAVTRTDVPGRTRLLADFHVVLARMLGNDVLAQMLADLLSRSSLISLMYQSSHSAEHSRDEHVAIVEALQRRDARAAVRLLEAHLGNVERNLRLSPRVADLGAVLQPQSLA